MNRQEVLRKYRRTFEGYLYLEFMDASYGVPKLTLGSDSSCYTCPEPDGGHVIHLGASHPIIASAENEKDLFDRASYVLGHECQHIHSTTDSQWAKGNQNGFRAIAGRLARRVTGQFVHLRTEADYMNIFAVAARNGYAVSPQTVQTFVHYVCNSLEDGRIEQIRMKKRKTFGIYVRKYRAIEWEKNEAEINESDDEHENALIRLTAILSQVYSLATSQLYQKGFLRRYADTDLYDTVCEFIPTIREAVSSPDCSGCMRASLGIISSLSDLIIEASRMKDFDDLVNWLQEQLQNDVQNRYSNSEDEKQSGETHQIFSYSALNENSSEQPDEEESNATVPDGSKTDPEEQKASEDKQDQSRENGVQTGEKLPDRDSGSDSDDDFEDPSHDIEVGGGSGGSSEEGSDSAESGESEIAGQDSGDGNRDDEESQSVNSGGTGGSDEDDESDGQEGDDKGEGGKSGDRDEDEGESGSSDGSDSQDSENSEAGNSEDGSSSGSSEESEEDEGGKSSSGDGSDDDSKEDSNDDSNDDSENGSDGDSQSEDGDSPEREKKLQNRNDCGQNDSGRDSHGDVRSADQDSSPVDEGKPSDHNSAHAGAEKVKTADVVEKAVRDAVRKCIDEDPNETTGDYDLALEDVAHAEEFRKKVESLKEGSRYVPDLSGLEDCYGHEFSYLEEYRKSSPTELPPTAIINEGAALRRKILADLRKRQPLAMRGLKNGKVDPSGLHRLATGDFNIFSRRGTPEKHDSCAYILQDNSGSMSGRKYKICCQALAVIEEAFRGVMPLKIVGFRCSCSDVIHRVVKEFDESDVPNYSWNYLREHNTHNGNMDGASIRIAARELLQRPEEDRILLVACDGYPCEYGTCDDGIADTRQAVVEAQKAGIRVIGLFIGNEQPSESDMDQFIGMYAPYAMAVSVNELSSELPRIMKNAFLNK